MADDTQNAWIVRVLGVSIPAPPAAGALASLAAATQAWRDASETVNAQISLLQSALRSSDDAELQDIGQYGVNAVTGNFKVPLMAALMGATGGNERDYAKLPGIIAGFRKHLESDPRVEACDENPFNVAISIRATLLPALDQIERSLHG